MSHDTKGDDAQNTPLFKDLGLDERLLRSLEGLGFESPTPIQSEAIPLLMEGRDVIGGARTGSGKTAAFGLPLLHRLRAGGRAPRALILAPTRELAKQVAVALDQFARYLPIKLLTIYGGVAYKQQLQALRSGVDVVVGTPGRVLDLMDRGSLNLSKLEVLVLDEADEMLQMGFIDDVEKVLAASPDGRQIALFSATMPPAIKRIAKTYLNDPAFAQVESKGLGASHVAQRWLKIPHRRKEEALVRILRSEQRDATLIFARTRASVAKLGDTLSSRGFSSDSLHGDLSQAARERVMAKLRARRVDVVVATDVAARGLDVNHITHVINYDLPENSEIYVHRIGRTARAGRDGWAITMATPREQGKINRIQRDIGQRIEQMTLPSDADIGKAQRASLVEELDAAIDASGGERAEAWLAEILDATEWTAEDVAAAALSLLALERDFDIRRAIPKAREQQTREMPQDMEERFKQLNEVELFFPVGRQDGMRPADFVGALCNDVGLASNLIGKISMGGNRAFVGLPREVAASLLLERDSIEIRGRQVPLRLAMDSSDGDSDGNSDRGSDRGSDDEVRGSDTRQEARSERPSRPPGQKPSAPNPNFKRGRNSKEKSKLKGRGKNKGKKTNKNKGKPKPKSD